jgi:hypothetical protein
MEPIDTRQHPFSSAYYGLSSLAISGILLFMATPALDLANTLQRDNYRGFSDSDKRLAGYGGYAGAGLALILCLGAVSIATSGLRVARQGREPSVLCVTALCLGLFATLVWVGCAVAWHAQAWVLVKPP